VTVDPNYKYMGYSIPRDVVSIQRRVRSLQSQAAHQRLGRLQGRPAGLQQRVSVPVRAEPRVQGARRTKRHRSPSRRPKRREPVRDGRGPQGRADAVSAYLDNGQFWRLPRGVGHVTRCRVRSRRGWHVRRARRSRFAARNLKVWTKLSRFLIRRRTSGTGDTQGTFGNAGPRSYFTGPPRSPLLIIRGR